MVKRNRWRQRWVAAAGLGSIAATIAADGTSVPSTPPPESNFQKVTLNGAPGEPIALVVLPDGRVLHSTRNGRIFLHDPATGFNRVVSTLPVYQHDEEGLQGLAIDADFERNHWLYVYYSPPLDTPGDDAATPSFNEGDAPLTGSEAEFARFRGAMRLSRFRLEGIVVAGSVDEGDGEVDFAISANCVTVPVHHTGSEPELFQEGIPVVLEGEWGAGKAVYESDRIVIRHTEEYTDDPDRERAEADEACEASSR